MVLDLSLAQDQGGYITNLQIRGKLPINNCSETGAKHI